jgi:hypothetical protein
LDGIPKIAGGCVIESTRDFDVSDDIRVVMSKKSEKSGIINVKTRRGGREHDPVSNDRLRSGSNKNEQIALGLMWAVMLISEVTNGNQVHPIPADLTLDTGSISKKSDHLFSSDC